MKGVSGLSSPVLRFDNYSEDLKGDGLSGLSSPVFK